MKQSCELISVVIPFFNAGKYIAECIESVLKQTYNNLEIILINDGSSDDSCRLCREFEKVDSRIVVIDQDNRGLAFSRERGFQLASGKYVVTIDADDYMEPTQIGNMYERIKMTDSDVCVCGVVQFDESGGNEKEIEILCDTDEAEQISEEMISSDFLKVIRKYHLSDSWNKLYKREFLVTIDAHFDIPNIYNGTDLLFNYIVFLHCPRVVFDREYLYHYRIVNNSRVRRRDKKLEQGFLFVTERLFHEIRIMGKESEYSVALIQAYVDMMRYAALSIYQEERDLINRYSEFMNYRYHYSTGIFFRANRKMTPGFVVFHAILYSGFSPAIYVYYSIRGLANRIILSIAEVMRE